MKTAVTFLVSMVLLMMSYGLFAQQGKPMAPAGSRREFLGMFILSGTEG